MPIKNVHVAAELFRMVEGNPMTIIPSFGILLEFTNTML